MTEEAREDLIAALLDEFKASIGTALTDERRFAFVAGARSALVSSEERLRASIEAEKAKLRTVNLGSDPNRGNLQILHAARVSALEDFAAR